MKVNTWQIVSGAAAAAILVVACGGKDKSPTAPTSVTASLTAPVLDSPAANAQLDTLRPTLTVRNATADHAGTRTYEFQISDSNSFTSATTSNVTGFAAAVGKTGVAEGADGKTSWTPDADLQPTTVFYWRVRAVQGTSNGPWSEVGKFKSRLVGFLRDGELYDPLIHGETVGQIVGAATFVPGKGIQLNDGTSYVKYQLPQTISNGEFSMDVEGLHANASGDKAKVFGMQEGQGDFITNKYRVDIQYRGVKGVPPNAITWRALYGSASDLGVRYEPDTATRFASVFALDPSTVYHWTATWGNEFRVSVLSGGIGGSTLYNVGMASPRGVYAPNPHIAYLGAPVGRSGSEAASIAGTIYRNVWLGNRPRPDSLGSALQ
ncbi:MAG: hypothetical protein DMF84_11245 [Acidobacteria bacterium]|nr:MAG: hypothetical protein DMF84_11245 [Acidobacteriota bacterium]